MPFLMQLTLGLFILSACASGGILRYQLAHDQDIHFHTLLAPYGVSALVLLMWTF